MTLDELLEWSRQIIATSEVTGIQHVVIEGSSESVESAIKLVPMATVLARGVLDLLGNIQPCGFEPPVVDKGMVSVLDGSDDPEPAYMFTPDEARWFAAALLRAADEAEQMERG